MEKMNIKVTADTYSAQNGFKSLSKSINETASSLAVTVGRLIDTKNVLLQLSNSRFKLKPDIAGNISDESITLSPMDNYNAQINAMQEMQITRKAMDTDLDEYRRQLDQQYLDWKTNNWIAQHEMEYKMAKTTMHSIEGFYRNAIDLIIEKEMNWKNMNKLVQESLKDLTKELLTTLVSTMVKAAAQAIISGFIIENAMRTPAMLTSLATAGTNSIGAVAGIQAAKGALGFAQGGLVSGPGTATSDSIPAFLSSGEFVVNARATGANLSLLQAINSGNSMDSKLDRIAAILSALNSNLVRKSMQVQVVNNSPDIESRIEYQDLIRSDMNSRGYDGNN